MSTNLQEHSSLAGELAKLKVSFGIPAYNEANGIIPTLNSLWGAMQALQVSEAPIIVSDSADSPSRSSALHVQAWAANLGARLIVDQCAHRRSQKEALNNIFDIASADLLIQMNADVIIPVSSLLSLFRHLLFSPRPVIAVGTVLPDPAFSRLAYRAGAWQMRSVWRAANRMPHHAVRSEGAFWGCWRSFYANFRYPVGTGSYADDAELARAIRRHKIPVANAADAFVYKIPPGSLRDFCSGRIRWEGAQPDNRRGWAEYRAGLIEAVHDPIGAAMYLAARFWCRAKRDRLRAGAVSEMWAPLASTKRQHN